jgi:hypothetical protein
VTFDDYMQEVLTRRQTGLGQGQRAGQFYFNVLWDVKPRLSNRVRGTLFDPFFNDEKIPDFLTFVGRHWDD